MQLYEKILKDVNEIAACKHTNSIKASELFYDLHSSDEIREAYALLKYEGLVELIFNSSDRLVYVERKPLGVTYFERKRKEAKKLVCIPIIISVLSNLIIHALQPLLPRILQWLSSHL